MPKNSECVTVQCSGLLFDMDGVLVSSIASANRCWRQWAALYDVAVAPDYEIPHGTRAVDIIRGLRPDLDDAGVAAGLRVIEDLEIADTADLKVLSGVRELLASLPADRWTIVTSASRRLMVGRLKAADLPFPDELITGDDVVKGKPDPEPYRKGAALLGFAPEDCIVVEDAPAGVGSGKAAGSTVLAVLGTHEQADLRAAGASLVVSSLADLKVTVSAEGLRLQFVSV